MRGEAGAGRGGTVGGGDMVPFAVMQDRVQPSCGLGAIIDSVQREALLGDAVERAAVHKLNAGKQIRRDLAVAAPARDAERIEKIVARPLVADRGRGAVT